MTTKRCGTMKPASNIRRARSPFNAAVFHTKIKDLQVTRRCRQLLVAHRVQRADKAHTHGRRGRIRRVAAAKASICRLPAATSRPSSTRRCRQCGPRRDRDRHPRRQPPAVRAEVPDGGHRRPTASGSATMPTGTSPPASSMSATASPSRATRSQATGDFGNMIFFDPVTGDFGRRRNVDFARR